MRFQRAERSSDAVHAFFIAMLNADLACLFSSQRLRLNSGLKELGCLDCCGGGLPAGIGGRVFIESVYKDIKMNMA